MHTNREKKNSRFLGVDSWLIPSLAIACEKQNGRAREEPGRCKLCQWLLLEALLQADVPEPAFDVSNRLVVTVLKAASHKRWIFIQHVLHAQRDGRVIKPPLPVAAAILGCGDGYHILLLAVFHLHILPTILGKARYLGRRRRRQVKCVVQDQIQRR